MTIVVVIYLPRDWRSNSPSDQGYFVDAQLIRAMARVPGMRVLCLNRPVTPIATALRKPGKLIGWIMGRRLERIDENLFLYTPFALVHDRFALHVPFAEKLNRVVLSYQIRKQLKGLGLDSSLRISWIYHPLQYGYLGLAGENLRVYECYDAYTIRESSENRRAKVASYESEVLSGCDLVFTPCHNIYEEKVRINKDTYFVPGAVEFDRFVKALSNDTAVPPDLARIGSPRVGFIGTINERVDINLINYLAERHPHWSLVMIGNISDGRGFLSGEAYRHSRGLSNVHYLGFRKYEDLPAYNKHLDVCLLPYRNIEVMNYAHPYKTYQHLAVGKPVVSTDIPDVRPLKDVVRIAKTYEEFSAMVEEALSDNGRQSIDRRVAVARQNTWEDRAQAIYEIICAQLVKRQLNKNG
jgi:glycosyltransferase involved in cell wall biosynthesis